MLSEETAFNSRPSLIWRRINYWWAIAILAWLVYSVGKHRRHTAMLYSLVAFAALRGFSTTMLEMVILPFGGAVHRQMDLHEEVAGRSLVAIAAAFLFFTPVKMEIRRVALEEAQTRQFSSSTSRAMDWVAQASEFWGETLSGRRSLTESTTSASSRTDLVHQVRIHSRNDSSVIPMSMAQTIITS